MSWSVGLSASIPGIRAHDDAAGACTRRFGHVSVTFDTRMNQGTAADGRSLAPAHPRAHAARAGGAGAHAHAVRRCPRRFRSQRPAVRR
jgi:hypothetical protein